MKEDDEILKMQFGRRHPFKVPTGYFESLDSRIVEQLPKRQKQRFGIRLSLSRQYRRIAAVAAVACLAVCGSVIYMDKLDSRAVSHDNALSSANAAYSDGTLDDIAEYAMMDNDDMYVLISDY